VTTLPRGPIAAVVFWQLRRGWRGLLMLALAVMLATAFVMTAVGGARRTASAWPRMRAATHAADVEAWVYDHPDELEAALRARPDVVATAQYAWMFVYPQIEKPIPAEGMYVALSDSYERDIAQPLIVAGRAADPTRADEVTINEAMADVTGLRPGDHVELRSGPDVVHQPATIVGIHRSTRDLNEDAGAISGLLTPAFGRKWFGPYRDAYVAEAPNGYPTVVTARFAPGTDLDAVTAQLRQEFGDRAPERVDDDVTSLGDALDAQRTAYALLAAIGGVAALAALGQAVSRRVRRIGEELDVLVALGQSRGQRVAATITAPAIAIAAGAVLAPAAAYLASNVVPRGLASRVDPSPGRHIDLLVAGLGVLAAVCMLGLIGLAAARRATRRVDDELAARHHTPVGHPAQLFGLRVACGWASRAGRAAARSHAGALIAAFALIVAVATWSTAAHHVTAAPRLWGTTWDVTVGFDETHAGDEFATADALWPQIDQLGQQLANRPDLVDHLATDQVGTVTIEGVQLEADVIDDRLGAVWPAVVHGRSPRGADELDAGAGIAGRADWHMGDELHSDHGSARLVGNVVAPNFGTGEFGQTLVMSPAALDRLGGFDLRNSSYLLIDLAPGATPEQLQQALDRRFTLIAPQMPSPVLGVRSIGSVDRVLLAFIAVVTLATLVQGVRSATRQRRRDHAVLRALGARPPLIARTTGWHVAYVVGLAIAVGVPVGLAAGRFVWSRTATSMGVVVRYPSPLPALMAIIGGALAASVVVAGALGVLAAGRATTQWLRRE
jgi:hypothetical protein